MNNKIHLQNKWEEDVTVFAYMLMISRNNVDHVHQLSLAC